MRGKVSRRKKTPVIIEIVIAVVILSMCYLLQPQFEEIISGKTPTGKAAEISTGVKVEAENKGKKEADSAAAVTTNGNAAQEDNTGATVAEAESPITVPDTEGIIPKGFIYSKVKRIVDGDTIKAECGSKLYTVRLLCIDTPETVKSGVSVQPYGKQASEKLKKLLLNKEVILVFEKAVYDRYDRLLAYVILKDGTCVNAFMVEQGYARVDTVKPNTIHKDYFEELQEDAISDKRGLWSLPIDERPFVEKDEGYYTPRYYDDAA